MTDDYKKISFQQVTKHYEGHTALDQVSFSISKGSIFGLLGPNGAGKTTLLRILTRILLPDTGRVLFEGTALSDEQVRRIGYLPEERGLYPKMKADEHLVFLASLKGMSSKQIKESIGYWSEKLELEGLLDRKVEALSKGQQQKVQLIAALVHHPDFIILDEPFSGFDPVNAELLKEIILELKGQGKTLLISTHRMENAEELCDEVVMLNKGQVVLAGMLETLLNDPSNALFQVKTNAPIAANPAYQILEESGNQYLIEVPVSEKPNEVLLSLTQQAQVLYFAPKRKSLKEVFLQQVREN